MTKKSQSCYLKTEKEVFLPAAESKEDAGRGMVVVKSQIFAEPP